MKLLEAQDVGGTSYHFPVVKVRNSPVSIKTKPCSRGLEWTPMRFEEEKPPTTRDSMSRRQELQEQIDSLEDRAANLREELANLTEYDWDNLSNAEIETIFKEDKDWNYWKNCPVGSLTKGMPEDKLLRLLAYLTYYAADRQWASYMYALREIVRMRMGEFGKKAE